MRQTWRWFGPPDKVTLSDIRQAGASGIVSALHHVPPGDVWTFEEITKRHDEIAASGPLTWDVVESLPITEDMRTGGPNRDEHIANWITSMGHLAKAGINVICYNFMPVLDWTRTELRAPMPSGANAMAFNLSHFAAFDIHYLKRANAAAGYDEKTVEQAEELSRASDNAAWQQLADNIMMGLPGAMESWSLDGLRERLAAYSDIDADGLRANLKYFLNAVVPEAERLDMRLCCHPDDPPWPVLGLPRIVSTERDYEWLVNTEPSPANGITFCTGSLGARADNDLPGMVRRLGSHIHFLHLRNVNREADTVPCSFFEDEHLAGSTDMVAVVAAVVEEEERRKLENRADWEIPMRPDHGQDILDDHKRRAAPGYPALGRMKGLAELRGVEMALRHAGGHKT